ncbi:MAG TPA: response regulator transcription factor [Mycobacteriales bacterium]|nr:response regulator transcription factor [Mycobacteriales bacterium]
MTSRDGPVVLRVLHVEDNAQMRHWLEIAVDGVDDLKVVGAAADGRDGVELAAELRPDVVVLDNSMPTMDGLDALPLIRQACPEARVVMWCNDPHVRDRALVRGAVELVDKAEPVERLIEVIRA